MLVQPILETEDGLPLFALAILDELEEPFGVRQFHVTGVRWEDKVSWNVILVEQKLLQQLQFFEWSGDVLFAACISLASL
jgi:hypothetical protein